MIRFFLRLAYALAAEALIKRMMRRKRKPIFVDVVVDDEFYHFQQNLLKEIACRMDELDSIPPHGRPTNVD